jgi:hypothetical protein
MDYQHGSFTENIECQDSMAAMAPSPFIRSGADGFGKCIRGASLMSVNDTVNQSSMRGHPTLASRSNSVGYGSLATHQTSDSVNVVRCQAGCAAEISFFAVQTPTQAKQLQSIASMGARTPHALTTTTQAYMNNSIGFTDGFN